MSGEGRSGRSTPSSWDGSQISIDSQYSQNSNSSSLRGPASSFTPEEKTCFLLMEKDSQWSKLDSYYKTCISQIDKLHQAGQGNSAECIKLTLHRNDIQEKIELLEDEIYRTGSCPKQPCIIHQRETQVRSTRFSNEKFEVISPKKAAKIRKINSTPEIQLENKFEQLMEVDKQNDQDEVKKSENDIPAVNLLMDSNYNLTLQEIANKFPKTTNKLPPALLSPQSMDSIKRAVNHPPFNDPRPCSSPKRLGVEYVVARRTTYLQSTSFGHGVQQKCDDSQDQVRRGGEVFSRLQRKLE
ncbi:hypothetical protein AVEN_267090-1 [Araneus ventricosus]|uniref:Uncharacterized protein n=1 Tax=Araneus ventricosus TaxID=182803 RepID=A0A4Y2WII0_ARAVE|nr:hypothetical protein AVEN_267090-1 [Araneus ventricosus]